MHKQAIIEPDKLLNSLFETIPDALLVINQRGQALLANPAARGLLDYPPDTADGQVQGEGKLLAPLLNRLSSLLEPFFDPTVQTPDTQHLRDIPHPGGENQMLNITLSSMHQGEEQLVLLMVRVEVQQSSRDREAMLPQIIDSLPAMVAYVDKEQRYRYANATHERWMQRPLENIIGHRLDEVLSPEVFQALEPHIAPVLAGEELRFRTVREFVPGERRIIETHWAPHRNDEGEVMGYFAVATDVTEYWELERALRESENDLRMVMDSVPAVLHCVDSERCYRVVNRETERWFQRPREEIVGASIQELLGPQVYQQVSGYVDRVLAGEEVHYELERDDPGAKNRVVQVTLRPGRDDNGQVCGFIGLVTDITEHRRLEQALLESNNRYRALFEHAPEPIVITDLHTGRYLDCNPCAEAFFGYSREQMLMMRVGDLSTPQQPDGGESRQQALANMHRVLGGEVLNFEWRCRRADGRSVMVEIQTVRIPWEGSYATRQSFIDISTRKAVETTLRQARRAAEEASEAKSVFLASMSHEIRTPLNAVIGMGRLLLESQLPVQEREFAEILHGSGQQLLALVNDVLDFSKIEAGQIELEQERFSLRGCIEGALDMLSHAATEKGLGLEYLIDGDRPGEPTVPDSIRERRCCQRQYPPDQLLGDETRLRQILVNLLSNAIKFTARGEVLLFVTSHPHNKAAPLSDRVELHFTVRDTGIGIPREAQSRLFQPFSQVSRGYGGTGLGLVISKRLVEAMDGQIWIESEPGKGSLFHVVVRLRKAPGNTLVLSPPSVLSGKRLLMIGASTTHRRLLTSLASDCGMHSRAIDTLAHGADLSANDADIAVVAVGSVAEAYRVAGNLQRGPGANPPMMVLLPPAGVRELPHPPFAACLSRPFKPKQIQDTLRVLCGDAPPQAAITSTPGLDASFAARLSLEILVVDDNVANQRLAILLLEILGYRADVVSSGEEALAALRRQPYDVVLLDMVMPGLDGLATTRLIRQKQYSRRPYLIAATANVTPEDRRRCLAAGMDDYLGKPLQVETLMSALQTAHSTVINTRGTEPEAHPAAPSNTLEVLRSALNDQGAWYAFLHVSLDSLNQQRRLLRTGLSAGDGEQVSRAAHSLKSNAANLGEESLRVLCESLEMLAGEGELAAVAPHMDELDRQLEAAQARLEQLLKTSLQ